MTAIFSIKPEYAEGILTGKKRVEYRRKKCRYPIRRILIYATHPVSRIVGEVIVEDVVESEIMSLWKTTSEYAGIDFLTYLLYFNGTTKAFAYFLTAPKKYEYPLRLESVGITRPPQSFCYLPSDNK